MTDSFTCRICGVAAQSPPIIVREMMFGTREAFPYRECPACGCLQIESYPDALARYYPEDYYSFTATERRHYTPGERWLHHHRARHALGRFDLVGLGVTRLFGALEPHRWLKLAGAGFESSILEIGCGTGFVLRLLHRDGFQKLEGVDPFVPDETRTQEGFRIRHSVSEARSGADFVLMSHSLEHMPDQKAQLAELGSVMADTGWACVRLPIASEAWRRFGAHWGQIDAPRHFYLHTVRSFRTLAEEAGFEIAHTLFDSSAMQFWWSEQNRRDIAFNDPRSHGLGHGTLFSAEQVQAWEAEAVELNRTGQGDQATFLLRRRSR
jgi:SAM-dependent methyltransferase